MINLNSRYGLDVHSSELFESPVNLTTELVGAKEKRFHLAEVTKLCGDGTWNNKRQSSNRKGYGCLESGGIPISTEILAL